jgi:phosphatidylinositol alpha-1,6-mannosyltransferase
VTPRRILIATQTFPPDLGGMEGLMGGLAASLAAEGHAVEVFADRIRSGRAELVAPGFALRRFGGPRPLRRLLKRMAIARALRGGPPAAVIADSWKSVAAMPREVGGALRRDVGATPLLVLAHGMEFPPDVSPGKAARIHAALLRATAVAANSGFTLDLLAPHLPRGMRCAVVPPPIAPQPEPSEADLAAARAAAGPGGPFLLTLARLEPRKGVDMLIRALPGLAASHPGITLLVAGDGPDCALLAALAAEAGVAARVQFLGRIEEGMKAALFRSADLFAMPTRREGASVEGFGIVYLEAAWHGLPALAGRDGGAAEAIADGETGLLCDGADPAAVEATLAALLGDPDGLRAMGARAAARVRTAFLWPAVLPRYIGLLAPPGQEG